MKYLLGIILVFGLVMLLYKQYNYKKMKKVYEQKKMNEGCLFRINNLTGTTGIIQYFTKDSVNGPVFENTLGDRAFTDYSLFRINHPMGIKRFYYYPSSGKGIKFDIPDDLEKRGKYTFVLTEFKSTCDNEYYGNENVDILFEGYQK